MMETTMTSARQVWERARPGDHVIGWKVDPHERKSLLERFVPKYAKPVAEHVTLKAKVSPNSVLPGKVSARLVGRADDGRGVEAMVVEIEGSSERPDGGTYHVTWSLAEGRQAHESNDVIRARGWEPFDTPVAVHLEPAAFR